MLAEFPTLRDVSISGSPITGAGLAHIARLSGLQRLELTGCRDLNDADFTVLGELYYLAGVQLAETAAGDEAVAALVRLNNLHELQIGSEQLTDAGVRKLCEIVSLRNLSITGDAAHLTDAAVVDLWRLVNLHSFGVSAPQITGSGLATIDELPGLEWMTLGGAGIADIALEHAAQSKSLKTLFVGSWQNGGPAALTDAGLLHVAGAQGLTTFDVMQRGTQVTDQGVAELRRRRPALRVNAHGP
jgi:hypothetical protein